MRCNLCHLITNWHDSHFCEICRDKIARADLVRQLIDMLEYLPTVRRRKAKKLVRQLLDIYAITP